MSLGHHRVYVGTRISVTCYWDTKTSNYAGVRFTVEVEDKDIVTIGKLYEIEKKLKRAHLNAGRVYVLGLDKKYFDL